MFVSRTSKSFDGTVQYVLWCSCDQQRALLADALPAINTECLTTFEQLRPPCLHIKAARHILMEVDGINDISPELDFSGKQILIFVIYSSHYQPQIIIMDLLMLKEDGRSVVV